MHLHNNECEKKVEDFASDDVVVDPGDPLRARDLLQILYPDSDRTERVVQPPERTALFRWGQAAEQDENRHSPLGRL